MVLFDSNILEQHRGIFDYLCSGAMAMGLDENYEHYKNTGRCRAGVRYSSVGVLLSKLTAFQFEVLLFGYGTSLRSATNECDNMEHTESFHPAIPQRQ